MARLKVRVTPRAASDSVDGLDAEDVLRVRVSAPPADDAANEAVVKLLSKALDIPARDVVLVAGAGSRQKLFSLPLEVDELFERLRRATSS